MGSVVCVGRLLSARMAGLAPACVFQHACGCVHACVVPVWALEGVQAWAQRAAWFLYPCVSTPMSAPAGELTFEL